MKSSEWISGCTPHTAAKVLISSVVMCIRAFLDFLVSAIATIETRPDAPYVSQASASRCIPTTNMQLATQCRLQLARWPMRFGPATTRAAERDTSKYILLMTYRQPSAYRSVFAIGKNITEAIEMT